MMGLLVGVFVCGRDVGERVRGSVGLWVGDPELGIAVAGPRLGLRD